MNTVNLTHMSVADVIKELPKQGVWTYTDDQRPDLAVNMDAAKFAALVESHERLLKLVKRIDSTIERSPVFVNFGFSLRTAIELAEKLEE